MKIINFLFPVILSLTTLNNGANLVSAQSDIDLSNFDLEEILTNQRLLVRYVDCLIDSSKCTPDSSGLREVLTEELETACSKCTEKQLKGAKKVLKYLKKRDERV